MINCGAIIDLTENSWLNDDKHSNLRIIVFDVHLPVNHNNINCLKKIWVFSDEDVSNIEMCPNPEDVQYVQEEERENENEDEEESHE